MKLTNQAAWDAQVALMRRALNLVAPKRHDYSGNDEPFANFNKSVLVGVEPWRGALARLFDKLSRLEQLAACDGQGQVKDESLVDTAADAVNYVCIAFCLILESLPEAEAHKVLGVLDKVPKWWMIC